jgi:hypothetical protein
VPAGVELVHSDSMLLPGAARNHGVAATGALAELRFHRFVRAHSWRA